ncbi:epoxyqueuosine reductase QueH [Malonomonas rubra]|uniref:epoxyqueuosine reductase QueH n=1 Tax=Malonomonas rubra TaxID=57040 RepID=UPI0026F2A4DF|nr:epoxyqueuosine reductase QueH [Malonomonas rubra]
MQILLHICCGNCAIYPVKRLRAQNHQLAGYFYNDNIHPFQEFSKRLATTKEYAKKVDLPVTYDEQYRLEDFLASVAQDPTNRCRHCYRSRLLATAKEAKRLEFEAFTTTLLYSRYQKHEEILAFGQQLAIDYNLFFYYEDFRKGWNEGIQISKQMSLYRQQYCGCIYSEKERFAPQKRADR